MTRRRLIYLRIPRSRCCQLVCQVVLVQHAIPQATHSTRSWLHQRLNLRRSDSPNDAVLPRQCPAHLGFPLPRLCPMDLQKSCRAGFQPAVLLARLAPPDSRQVRSTWSLHWCRPIQKPMVEEELQTPMFRPATVASFLIPLAVPKVRAEVPVLTHLRVRDVDVAIFSSTGWLDIGCWFDNGRLRRADIAITGNASGVRRGGNDVLPKIRHAAAGQSSGSTSGGGATTATGNIGNFAPGEVAVIGTESAVCGHETTFEGEPVAQA